MTITATYDRLNRVLTVDDEDAGTTADTMYTYDLTDPGWTDPTGTYAVTLDKFDRPVALDDPVTAGFTFSYRADGQPWSKGDPNANTTAFGYDALGRPSAMTTTGTGGASRAAYAWTRNAAGAVRSEQTTITGDPGNGTRTFGYDALGRLVTWSDDGGTTETSYGWDKVLNRTSVDPPGAAAIATAYDAANRPTDQAGVASAYASDADGRLTARPDATGAPAQHLAWDTLGRLVEVSDATGHTPLARYAYDPLDRLRTVDHGAGDRIRFRYQGLTTSAVQVLDDDTGAVIRHLGTGWGGEPLADWTGTGQDLRIFGRNGHHDLTWTAGSGGSVTGTVRYDPWGSATSVTGSVPDLRFQGSYADEVTGLSWVVSRWYAPAEGRFLSEDSLLGEPRDPDSRHLYAYGGGDPVGAWDPDGMRPSTAWWVGSYRYVPNRERWIREGKWFDAVDLATEGVCTGVGIVTIDPIVTALCGVASYAFAGWLRSLDTKTYYSRHRAWFRMDSERRLYVLKWVIDRVLYITGTKSTGQPFDDYVYSATPEAVSYVRFGKKSELANCISTSNTWRTSCFYHWGWARTYSYHGRPRSYWTTVVKQEQYLWQCSNAPKCTGPDH